MDKPQPHKGCSPRRGHTPTFLLSGIGALRRTPAWHPLGSGLRAPGPAAPPVPPVPARAAFPAAGEGPTTPSGSPTPPPAPRRAHPTHRPTSQPPGCPPIPPPSTARYSLSPVPVATRPPPAGPGRPFPRRGSGVRRGRPPPRPGRSPHLPTPPPPPAGRGNMKRSRRRAPRRRRGTRRRSGHPRAHSGGRTGALPGRRGAGREPWGTGPAVSPPPQPAPEGARWSPGPASRLPPSAGPWAARGGAEARAARREAAAAAGAKGRCPGGEMSAPYGSLMRYLFPALLLHGECEDGSVARGVPRPPPAHWVTTGGAPEKPAGLRGGPITSLVGGRGSRVGALARPGCGCWVPAARVKGGLAEEGSVWMPKWAETLLALSEPPCWQHPFVKRVSAA